MATVVGKVEVECPECGQKQMESENYISTSCRRCGEYLQSSRAKSPVRRKTKRTTIAKRELSCADCGAVMEIAIEAQSSSCLACGRHLELGHREILGEHLGNYSLEGELRIGPRGNFGGAKARAARIFFEGRATGFLEAAEWLRVKGQTKTRSGMSGGKLEVEAGASLECGEGVSFLSGKIEGELRCKVAHFQGPLEIGPKGSLVAERVSFTELTVEVGGKIEGQGESSSFGVRGRGQRSKGT